MQELLKKAGLTSAVLKDPSKRASAIDEYNAKAGGLRTLMRGGKLEPAPVHEIPSQVSTEQTERYLNFIAAGKRIPILFAAGRATRMKLPRAFDRLGIGGLTPKILEALQAGGGEAETLVNAAANGDFNGLDDLSFLQRQLLQLRYQTGLLMRGHDDLFQQWLANASFAVVANGENRSSLALQLAAIGFGGLRPEHVYFLVQPEAGGLEILPDGSTKAYSKDNWPEGHGKPFLDMRSDASAVFRLNARGHLVPVKKAFISELSERGVERAVFAQVNDLHLLEDMAHLERWAASDALIEKGAEMVLEMVANGLQQKGGGIFSGKNGTVVMRDSIALRTKDLEPYSVPQSLSRMFYELTVSGMAKLKEGSLPEYLTERQTAEKKAVLTREFYSGDASGMLKAQAMQMAGYELDTFKMQSRIPEALSALKKQALQPGFSSLLSTLK